MDLQERGIPLVSTYCTFMPQRDPMAAGAVVVSLCSTSDETIEEAEKDLPRNLCPLIKAVAASAKPINAPTSTFLIWWSVKPPATAKKMYEYMAV
ncbi:MAG: 2-hydroxyacyl-CoA dehydratase [Escherichia sp.]